ncbi:hypothetical protein MXB_4107, partial [Myxobolus squamalis]
MFWMCRIVSIISIISICALNCRSEQLTIRCNNILTYEKFICMSVIIGLGIYKLGNREFENFKDPGFNTTINISGISFAIYNGLWAYDGFNQLGYIVNKMKNREQNLVKATVIGMMHLVILSMLPNLQHILILKNIPHSSHAAQRGHFPKLFAATHIKFKTCTPALIIQTFITMLFLIFSKNIDGLLMYFSAASWVSYSLVFAGVLISRYRYPLIDRPFQVWRFIPYLMLIISILVIFLGFLCDWRQSLISISIILFTIPCYFLFVYNGGIIPSCVSKAFGTYTALIYRKFDAFSFQTFFVVRR